MYWTCHSQLIWRLATQIYRNCHRTWLRQHNWWNGDVSNFPTLAKNIQQRREVHRIGQQNSISAFLHLLNLMYGGVNQRFPSNGNLIERGSPKIEASCKSYLMSSVGSSYSHPDLLLIHHHQQIFHACMGMTCALFWQNLARIWHTLSVSGTHFGSECCKMMLDGTRCCNMVKQGPKWCRMVPDGAICC